MIPKTLSLGTEIDKRCNGRIDIPILNSFIFLKRAVSLIQHTHTSYQKTFTIAGIKYKYSKRRKPKNSYRERTFGIRNMSARLPVCMDGLSFGDGFEITFYSKRFSVDTSTLNGKIKKG